MGNLGFNWTSLLWATLPLALGIAMIFFLYKRERKVKKGLFLSFLAISCLFLLCFQLAQPVWTQREKVYSLPVLVVAVDRSLSYQKSGHHDREFLINKISDSLRSHYIKIGFQIQELEFTNQLIFPDHGIKTQGLTDFGAVLKQLRDSLPWRNTRSVFLFTDGQSHGEDEKEIPDYFPYPLYPIVLRDTGKDTKILNVRFHENKLEFTWVPGANHMKVELGALTASGSPLSGFPNLISRGTRPQLDWIPLTQTKADAFKIGPVKIFKKESDTNPANDTVIVDAEQETSSIPLYFDNSISSLDGKWIASILSEKEGLYIRDLKMATPLKTGIQHWFSFSQWEKALQQKSDRTHSPIVFYGPEGQNQKTPLQWIFFPAESKMKTEELDLVFPEWKLAGDIFSQGVSLPEVSHETEGLLLMSSKGWGCLLCVLNQGENKVFLFPLQGIWRQQFSPYVPADKKELIRRLVFISRQWIHQKWNRYTIHLPKKILEEKPATVYVVENVTDTATLNLFIDESPVPLRLDTKNPGSRVWVAENHFFPKGWRWITLQKEGKVVHKEKIRSGSLREIELKNTGTDDRFLEALAAKSGGEILRSDSSGLLSSYPELSPIQTLSEKRFSWAIFNNPILFGICIGLLTVYWFFRKKKGLD